MPIQNHPGLDDVVAVANTCIRTALFSHATSDLPSLVTNVTSTGFGRSAEFRVNGTAECYYGHFAGFPGFVQPNTTGFFFFGVANAIDYIFINPLTNETAIASPTCLVNTVLVAGGINLPNGSAGTPALKFTNSVTTGLYRIGADDIGFSVAGVLSTQWASNKFSVRSGLSTATRAIVGGTINVNTTAVGNVGTGEDDLMTYSVPANVLGANGDYLEIECAGTFANAGGAKRLRAYFGSTVIFDTTAVDFIDSDWRLKITIIRTGAATQKAICAFNGDTTLVSLTADYTAPAETLSSAVTFRCTGEATNNDDITQELLIIKSY